MINWLAKCSYKQTALLMSSILAMCLILGGLAIVAFGNPHPSVTYWDAVLYPVGIFCLSLAGFMLMPSIWPANNDTETE